MYKVLFVCLGNICRSPMAEMIYNQLIRVNNRYDVTRCDSRGLSTLELGNSIYPQAEQVLTKHNIKVDDHKADVIKKDDYENYDIIICMDNANIDELVNFFGGDPDNKIHLLMSYADKDEEIEDPWYTGNFDKVYNLIEEGCTSLFKKLVEKYDNDLLNQ